MLDLKGCASHLASLYFGIGSHRVAQAGLKLGILLLQLPEWLRLQFWAKQDSALPWAHKVRSRGLLPS